jgi:hypothetical protein
MKIDGMLEWGAENIIWNEDKEEIDSRLEKTNREPCNLYCYQILEGS